jgi:exodeoxyribonuclease VII small subunit
MALMSLLLIEPPPMTKAPKSTLAPPTSYDAALQELEQLVTKLESGQLPLEQLMAGYQRGAELLTFCRDKLAAVEKQISVIDNGQLQPWTQE